MLRVGVMGAMGRMGQEVCRAVAAAPDLELVAAVDAGAGPGGEPLDRVPGLDRPGLRIAAGREELVRAGAEVTVDFTVADAARENVPWCAAQGIHAVVGTTGLGEADLDRLAAAFTGAPANAVVAPNFAIGAVLLMHFCRVAAPYMDGVEVIELHHDAKRDAPSGTALRTATGIAEARRAAGLDPLPPDATTEHVVAGARGGQGPGGVRLHSVRLPGLVAHEEVIFGAPGQSLTIRHDSYDRRSFMAGVLLAVRRVPSLPGLTRGLEPLLGL